ncbi:MAG: AgmX/PglI C-terminal domain-containing protein [Calditrichaeota bacterium]|nr:AgmX/PglI C-terminal domain-containing protein [Calditrichota bacterium]
MTQAMTFPREFERSFFRDLDRNFFTIWLICFILGNGICLYMAGQPVKELTAEQVKRYTEAIYRVKTTAPAKVAKKAETKVAVGEEKPVDEAPKVEEKKAEVRSMSAEEKAERLSAEREARRQKQEARRQAIAERVKIVAGPTARGGARRGGAAAAREAIGLSSGQMSGFNVKEMVGMVGEAGTAEKVKKLRGGGAVSADVGDIDISALKTTFSADELDLMVNEAPLQVSKSAITAKGSGTKAKQRSQGAIGDLVLQNKNQVQYCYWTLKKRDSSLKGRLVVEFTIAPSGEVIRVRFRESNWGGNSLGGDVERCIENVLKSWHFEAIPDADGNVTAGATYIFE